MPDITFIVLAVVHSFPGFAQHPFPASRQCGGDSLLQAAGVVAAGRRWECSVGA